MSSPGFLDVGISAATRKTHSFSDWPLHLPVSRKSYLFCIQSHYFRLQTEGTFKSHRFEIQLQWWDWLKGRMEN